MKVLIYASFSILTYSAFFSSASLANNTFSAQSGNQSNNDDYFVAVSAGTIFTAEMRTTIKREVMSQPGVLLDMANMIDNGYAWTNDVVWSGSSAPVTGSKAATKVPTELAREQAREDQWYIAGFMFERPQHKGVWLQYAFTLSEYSGKITNFRRWYGNTTFR